MDNSLLTSADLRLQAEDLNGCLDRLDFLSHATAAGLNSSSATPQRYIDWNILQPDGTGEALNSLLKSLSQRTGAVLFLGHLSRMGHAKDIHSSDTAWDTLKRKPLWLRNMLVEAAHSRCVIGSSQAFGTLTAVFVQANRELACTAVLGFGLELDAGQPRFGCALGLKQSLTLEQADALTIQGQLLADELRPWIRTWHHNHVARRWISGWNQILGLGQARRGRLVFILLLMAALLATPLPYWPRRACVIEPAVRRYIASPMDGRVLESLVKPGDTVTQGQILARLDQEDLQWSLDSAQAEYEATAKKRDIGMATKSSGNMRVAQLELQQIAVRIDAIKANMQRLTVRSPIDGIVLQGDWFRSQGAPVSRGDTLFEVAPLDRMTVEVHLSTEDLAEIHIGDTVTLRVDSDHNQLWHGQLQRIDPRAKVINDQLVFVGELEIIGCTEQLKPGMKGTVTLASGQRTIGWLLFHRPWQWLLKKLFW